MDHAEWGPLTSERQRADALLARCLAPGVPETSSFDPPERPDRSPLDVLSKAFALDGLGRDLVFLTLLPQIDARYEAVFAFLHRGANVPWLTAELACRVLGDTVTLESVLAATSPDGALMRLGILEPIEETLGHRSLRDHGFRLARGVVHFLLGLEASPAEIATFVTRAGARSTLAELPCSAARADRLGRIPELYRSRAVERRPLLLLLGPSERGQREIAEAVLNELELPLAVIDLERARSSIGWPHTTARVLSLELRLRPAGALLARAGQVPAEELEIVAEPLRRTGLPIFLACEVGAAWREIGRALRSLVIDARIAGFDDRLAIWEAALQRAELYLSPMARAALADRFCLGLEEAEAAIASARDVGWVHADGSPWPRRIADAVRRTLRADESRVAAGHRWEDLVVEPGTLDRLKALAGAARHRHLVYEGWGMGGRSRRSAGLRALFRGPSGTGKTLCAAVIANDLGLDLHRVDLSRIVSKYLGETEKNLDEIFASARRGEAILFFDEADALFGKRSEVKDARDRHANVQVAYLLQKLEEHDGLVILATNLSKNVDAAFSRRLEFVIDFSLPGPEERERLWQRMFPPQAPVAGDIDWHRLGRDFALSGGEIRNVALDAAFMAAEEGRRIDMGLVSKAMSRQRVKQGMMPSRVDTGEGRRGNP